MKKFVFFVFVPVFLGVVIYKTPITNPLYIELSNYLPDFLWAYSLASLFLLLGLPNKIPLSSVCVALFVSFLFEFCQLDLIPGTFDLFDLVVYSMGCFMPFYLLNKTR